MKKTMLILIFLAVVITVTVGCSMMQADPAAESSTVQTTVQEPGVTSEIVTTSEAVITENSSPTETARYDVTADAFLKWNSANANEALYRMIEQLIEPLEYEDKGQWDAWVYYDAYYRCVYAAGIELPEIVSAELVDFPEELKPFWAWTVDFAVCLTADNGDRYTVVLSAPFAPDGFRALYLNDTQLYFTYFYSDYFGYQSGDG